MMQSMVDYLTSPNGWERVLDIVTEARFNNNHNLSNEEKHAIVFNGCDAFQRHSFLRATPKRHGVIALDLPKTLSGSKRRGEEYRNASQIGLTFHRVLFYGPLDPPVDVIQRLALGFAKSLIVTPDALAAVNKTHVATAMRCLLNLSSTADILFMAETPEGFRLLQLMCLMLDPTNGKHGTKVLRLQSCIFAVLGVRRLFDRPVSLHVDEEDICEVRRRTVSLGGFWMKLKVPAKGWTHLNKAVNYRYKQYKMWQHYIAVDRAILWYCFKLCKGPLGRMHTDVVGEVESYLYGGHSWPSFFFRDTYSRTRIRSTA